MSGMGSLYIGVAGLQTSQNALNTTAHNLANVETDGYVRQQVVQSDTLYNTIKYGAVSNQQIGLGSKVAQVAQVRDYFLDKSYREEAGRAAFYGTAYETYYEVETIMDDMEGAEFNTSLTELKNAFDKLSTDPTDASYLAYLKQKVVKFIENAQNCYQALADYQGNINDQAIDTIDRINELSQEIYDLNKKIASIEAGKVENANDLRDARNAALDELSSLIKISYEEDVNNMVHVYAEGVPLVDPAYVNELEYTTDKVTGFITPSWEMFEQPVFNMDKVVSADIDTDIGKLKSLLMQRGDYSPNYSTIPVESDFKDENGNWVTGNWEINGTTYTDGEQAYEAKLDYYNNRIYTSGLMSTMAQLDYLVHGIVTSMNDILCPNIAATATADIVDDNGNVIVAAGQTYSYLDTDNCSVGLNGEMGVELFTRGSSDRYTEYTVGGETFYLYNEEDPTKEGYSYSIMSIAINSTVKEDPSSLPLYKQNNEVDYEGAAKLIGVWDEDFAVLDPNDTSENSFEDYYTKLVGQVATKGSVYNALSTSADSTVATVESNRQMIIGVSSDEELSNMIRYQNAYNAASRYISTVADMLEHLVVSLGS